MRSCLKKRKKEQDLTSSQQDQLEFQKASLINQTWWVTKNKKPKTKQEGGGGCQTEWEGARAWDGYDHCIHEIVK